MREQSSKYDLCQVVYDDTIEDGFHGFVTKLDHLLQLSVRSALRFAARELWYFSQRNRRENLQNRTKSNNKAREKFGESCRFKSGIKNRSYFAMASCRLSSEIEGAKNRLSPVQQKSRIPVRIVNHLNNNSGKSSSSKDEVNMQRILKNRLEKNQNKPPSRIPIPICRTNSKDVGRDKIPKTVITATGKKPLGTITGIVQKF